MSHTGILYEWTHTYTKLYPQTESVETAMSSKEAKNRSGNTGLQSIGTVASTCSYTTPSPDTSGPDDLGDISTDSFTNYSPPNSRSLSPVSGERYPKEKGDGRQDEHRKSKDNKRKRKSRSRSPSESKSHRKKRRYHKISRAKDENKRSSSRKSKEHQKTPPKPKEVPKNYHSPTPEYGSRHAEESKPAHDDISSACSPKYDHRPRESPQLHPEPYRGYHLRPASGEPYSKGKEAGRQGEHRESKDSKRKRKSRSRSPSESQSHRKKRQYHKIPHDKDENKRSSSRKSKKHQKTPSKPQEVPKNYHSPTPEYGSRHAEESKPAHDDISSACSPKYDHRPRESPQWPHPEPYRGYGRSPSPDYHRYPGRSRSPERYRRYPPSPRYRQKRTPSPYRKRYNFPPRRQGRGSPSPIRRCRGSPSPSPKKGRPVHNSPYSRSRRKQTSSSDYYCQPRSRSNTRSRSAQRSQYLHRSREENKPATSPVSISSSPALLRSQKPQTTATPTHTLCWYVFWRLA